MRLRRLRAGEVTMPRKPTQQFGHIAFGKDGSVKKVTKKLPDEKVGQEAEVARNFATGLAQIRGKEYTFSLCDENDHDFWLHDEDEKILIQAVEIVSRDYLRELDFNDYLNGRHSYTELYLKSPTEILGVDVDAKENIILDRIKLKFKKHYAKPKDPLWLLIWTVCDEFYPFVSESGTLKVSTGVTRARHYLSQHGAAPFDEIWFLNVELAPKRIWPE